MGGGNSTNSPTPFMSHMVMPLYYIENASLNETECAQIQDSWQLILDDKGPGYLQAKRDNLITEDQTGVVHFYDHFYNRLFDVHPSSRALFQCNMIVMGKMLVAMLTAAVKLLTDLAILVPKLQTLAKVHSEKGVMSYQYGIVGEVLLWALNKCLGAEYFEEVKVSWVKVYSIILSVMIPEALRVEAEMYNKSKTEAAYTETKSTSGPTTTTTTTTDES